MERSGGWSWWPACSDPSCQLHRPRQVECATNCAKECGSCTKILGQTVCAPSRQTCFKACLKEQKLICLLKAAEKVGLVHGRYCGLGNKAGPPVDALDAACRAHDRCWAKRGQFACSCDRQLVNHRQDRSERPRFRQRPQEGGPDPEFSPGRIGCMSGEPTG